jgi:hypothetical protein
MIINHGWRIAEISQEQEDITLYCFSLFQSRISFPISFCIIKQIVKSETLL